MLKALRERELTGNKRKFFGDIQDTRCYDYHPRPQKHGKCTHIYLRINKTHLSTNFFYTCTCNAVYPEDVCNHQFIFNRSDKTKYY